MRIKNILWFNEASKDDVSIVGGKGANLGEMTQANFPVPFGFIVSSHAYFDFIKEAQIEGRMKDLLKNINFENPHELQQGARLVQDLILNAPFPKKLAHEIIDFYHKLVFKERDFLKKTSTSLDGVTVKLGAMYKSPLVAVRSSATAEDLPNASFAGQQETYLNVKGESNLLRKVQECWASLFTERAIYYRHTQKFDHFKVGLAAVVQHMVQSDRSGVAFSVDPVTNDKSKIVIEAIYGLGEYIVQGKVSPDDYVVDKHSFTILHKEIQSQSEKFVKSGTSNKSSVVARSLRNKQKISDEEILKLAILIKEIENHYYFPQDIEWAIEKGSVFIVQSRPITTLHNKEGKESTTSKQNQTPILLGSAASPGIGVGPVILVKNPSEISRVKKGDVLVAPQTNPDYVPAMRKAAAIVTEKGGRTSHAAIVSRELGIPAVVGAPGAMKLLKDEQIVSVNGALGEVYKGSILTSSKFEIRNSKLNGDKHYKELKTLTKVYVNLAEPEQADKVAHIDVDGVGLLRAEFMIANIGIHPQVFIKKHRHALFIRRLTHDLLKFVKPFNPRPVIYRSTDFKTNEYRNLKGGKEFEQEEENPMLGFRGVSRYIKNSDVFTLELQAIKEIWRMGYKNLHLMVPFIRRPWELIRIKEIVAKNGLFDYHGFKLYMMVEVPAAAVELEEFLKIGVDGVSIGTNDLTMMMLGVDRDNQEVSDLYDERAPAVMSMLEHIVKTCAQYGVSSSICGQAASDYPDVVEKLIDWGATSVSVNPDAIQRTRELIHQFEKDHFKKIKRNYDSLHNVMNKLHTLAN